jgi:hypothetical protein
MTSLLGLFVGAATCKDTRSFGKRCIIIYGPAQVGEVSRLMSGYVNISKAIFRLGDGLLRQRYAP